MSMRLFGAHVKLLCAERKEEERESLEGESRAFCSRVVLVGVYFYLHRAEEGLEPCFDDEVWRIV